MCSAAWSVPRSFGICSSPSSCAGSGQNQTASVSNVVSGMSERDDVDRRAVANRLALRSRRPARSPRRARSRARRRAARSTRSAPRSSSPSPSSPACTSRRSRGRRARPRSSSVERLDEVLLAEMEVDGSLVHRRVGAVALDEPEQRSRLGVDHRERLRVARAQRDARRGIVAALPDVAGRRALELGELGRAAQRLGAERRRRRPRRAAPRRRRRGRADRGCAGSRGRGSPPRRAARGARPARARRTGRARRRCATSTASPRPRRPARPHCCRSDATVPGNPTEIAQSRRPMSIPSSSASVAVTPRSSPSTRRRSISRRCSARVAGAIRSEPARRREVDALGTRSDGSAPPPCGSSRSRSSAARAR